MSEAGEAGGRLSAGREDELRRWAAGGGWQNRPTRTVQMIRDLLREIDRLREDCTEQSNLEQEDITRLIAENTALRQRAEQAEQENAIFRENAQRSTSIVARQTLDLNELRREKEQAEARERGLREALDCAAEVYEQMALAYSPLPTDRRAVAKLREARAALGEDQ